MIQEVQEATSSDEVLLVSRQAEPIIEATSTVVELDDCSCITWLREHPFYGKHQPPRTALAKDLPITLTQPHLGVWSVYKVGFPYGDVGHTGGVLLMNEDQFGKFFIEDGFNLETCKEYQRKVYYTGEKQDKSLKGFFANVSKI